MYKLLRSVLFFFDPEKVHYFSMNNLKWMCKIPFIKKWIINSFKPMGNFQSSMCGIQFSNKVGLGAGFDKNAAYLNELQCLGFGFVEIGTVTPKPQAGNDKPRLFRLPKDKALVNRMGFNNDGVAVIAERLKAWQQSQLSVVNREFAHSPLSSHHSRLIIGGNIGKNKITKNEDAWKDYEICFTALHDYVDYFVVNVSSPNTPGLRALQEKDALRKILENLQMLNAEKDKPKPILLKIAPDLSKAEIDDVIDLALEIKLDGLVATNTTIYRKLPNTSPKVLEQLGPGGLSGLPLKNKSTEIIKYIAQKTNGQIPIIASGGIFTGADAKEKLNAGASLVQVWTGFIYEGPAIVKRICNELKTTGN
ncbi:quinone-dependent dihydroorotate dehydrogenase [Ferruginibacter sp.]|nr:quinone-dependent dihydroorotate dehydrogenase [Ferruginibacter sp.]